MAQHNGFLQRQPRSQIVVSLNYFLASHIRTLLLAHSWLPNWFLSDQGHRIDPDLLSSRVLNTALNEVILERLDRQRILRQVKDCRPRDILHVIEHPLLLHRYIWLSHDCVGCFVEILANIVVSQAEVWSHVHFSI